MPVNKNNCRGFTLMELMVGLVIGLIASAAILAGFIAVSKNTKETVSLVSLSGTVRDAMTYVSREFRRIGYWDLAKYAAYPDDSIALSSITGGNVIAIGTNNVFDIYNSNGGAIGLDIVAANGLASITGYTNANTVITDVLSDFDATGLSKGAWRILSPFDAATNPFIIDNASSDCVLYQYDVNGDTVLDSSTEQFGLRLNGNTLEKWTADTYSCTGGTWNALSDPGLVKYTSFDLNLNEATIDIDGSGDGTSMMVIRSISITITGQHPSDVSLTRTITKQIKIRNNRYVP